MQEGESKGFSEVLLEPIIKVGDICLKANKFETELQKVLKDIKDTSSSNKDVKPKVLMNRLLELQEEADKLRVYLDEIEELN